MLRIRLHRVWGGFRVRAEGLGFRVWSFRFSLKALRAQGNPKKAQKL